jgi:methionyl-tRNA formyltransferase
MLDQSKTKDRETLETTKTMRSELKSQETANSYFRKRVEDLERQVEEEKEELEIAGQIDAAKDLHDLSTLLKEGRMKEFYALANKVMRIKRSNPVVTKVKRISDNGDVEIFEEKTQVEKAISDYFTEIYKRPEHMMV